MIIVTQLVVLFFLLTKTVHFKPAVFLPSKSDGFPTLEMERKGAVPRHRGGGVGVAAGPEAGVPGPRAPHRRRSSQQGLRGAGWASGAREAGCRLVGYPRYIDGYRHLCTVVFRFLF